MRITLKKIQFYCFFFVLNLKIILFQFLSYFSRAMHLITSQLRVNPFIQIYDTISDKKLCYNKVSNQHDRF